MLLLLFVCIAVPAAAFGFLSLREVQEKFHQETVRRMRLQSRTIAMAIHTALSSAETQAEFLAGMARLDTSAGVGPPRNREGTLLGATYYRNGSPAKTLFGRPVPAPPMDAAARAHLDAGNGLLYLARQAGGGTRIFLAQAVSQAPPGQELLSCELNAEYLWGRVRDELPPVSDVAVLLSDGAPLFQTRPLPAAIPERISRSRDRGAAGYFEWRQGTDDLLVDHFAVFLKPAFLADDWLVAVAQPRSEAFAAAQKFSRLLFLSIALVVLVSWLFALVQVRRNLAPLALLNDATRRISGGDFDSRVEIASGDEFEMLACSFNAMAERLGAEFRTQAEMGRTVQAILVETDRERIVRAVLGHIGTVIPCDSAGLLLARIDAADATATLRVRDGSPLGATDTRTSLAFLAPDEIRRLRSAETAVDTLPGGDFARIFAGWPAPGPAVLLLAPLIVRGELQGVLALGYRERRPPGDKAPILLRQVADQASISLTRSRLLEELSENDLATLQALAGAVDTNSPWTAGHSRRVTVLAMEIGKELGLPPDEIDLLRRGGLLHDIGKLGIPPAILDKPGKLTDEELAVMKGHPAAGAKILVPIPSLQRVLPIVVQHHEWFDGSGYPQGLAGDAISFHARITALADVVEALGADRPYRPGWTAERIRNHVSERRGSHFDPAVVDAFLRLESLPGEDAGLARSHDRDAQAPDPLSEAALLAASAAAAAAGERPISGYSEPSHRD
jgi:putative nucleotidyltransferase with HDIG domain